MTSTESKWAERIRAWRASGLSASEFAAKNEFEATTLRYWASRLERALEAPSVRMVRVTTPGAAPSLVVIAGDARIEVRPGFDANLLRAVIAALESKA